MLFLNANLVEFGLFPKNIFLGVEIVILFSLNTILIYELLFKYIINYIYNLFLIFKKYIIDSIRSREDAFIIDEILQNWIVVSYIITSFIIFFTLQDKITDIKFWILVIVYSIGVIANIKVTKSFILKSSIILFCSTILSLLISQLTSDNQPLSYLLLLMTIGYLFHGLFIRAIIIIIYLAINRYIINYIPKIMINSISNFAAYIGSAFTSPWFYLYLNIEWISLPRISYIHNFMINNSYISKILSSSIVHNFSNLIYNFLPENINQTVIGYSIIFLLLVQCIKLFYSKFIYLSYKKVFGEIHQLILFIFLLMMLILATYNYDVSNTTYPNLYNILFFSVFISFFAILINILCYKTRAYCIENSYSLAAGFYNLAKRDLNDGNYKSSKIKFREALRIYEQIRDPIGKSATFFQLGVLENKLGHYDKSIRLIATSFCIDESIQHEDSEKILEYLYKIYEHNYTKEDIERITNEVIEDFK